MAALGNSVGLLFKIRAENQTSDEFAKVKGDITSLTGGLAGLAGPAGVAAAAIVAIGTAAIATAHQLFTLAQSASEFGSKIYDAQVKTGLSAATLTTLKINADSAGASFEQIVNSVGKFNVLLGTGDAVLAKYGITATDTNTALEQAIKTIAEMATADERAAAAKELFKDKTLAILPVIEQMNGSLKEAREKAEKLGLTLSEDDVRAADAFGDAWTQMTAQIQVGAAKFALEYAPLITDALTSISQFLAQNKDEWAVWGRIVENIIQGTISVINVLKDQVNLTLNVISMGLIRNTSTWTNWASHILFAISPVLWALEKIGQLAGGGVGRVQEGGGGASPRISIPTGGGGRGGGGGGGGRGSGGQSAEEKAEQARKKAVQEAMDEMRDRNAIFQAGYAQQLALLDYNLAAKLTSEDNYIKAVAKIHQNALRDEILGYKTILATQKLNAEERKDIENKIAVLESKRVTDAIKDETKLEKLKQDAHEKELKRLQDISEKRQQAAQAERERRFEELKDRTESTTLDGGGFAGGIANAIGVMSDSTLNARDKMAAGLNSIAASWQSMKGVAMDAINSLVQGIGNMVQAWVLYGTAGPNALKKMLATVLATVAAQAVVLAIFETAKGFAALFWNPGEAAAHFKAAALFAVVAAVAGGAGRGIAGNAFQSQTSGGGGGGSQGATSHGDRFTETFNGFGNRLDRIQERTNTILGGVEEQLHKFNQKFGTVSPGAVVMAGASDGAQAIFDAHTSVLGSGGQSTETMIRAQGRFR